MQAGGAGHLGSESAGLAVALTATSSPTSARAGPASAPGRWRRAPPSAACAASGSPTSASSAGSPWPAPSSYPPPPPPRPPAVSRAAAHPVGLFAARRLELDAGADRRVPQRAADRRLRRELALRRSASVVPTSVQAFACRWPRRDLGGAAEGEGRRRIRLGHDRIRESLAQALDPRLEVRLVVLGDVVLGVLLQVSELARGLDPRRHLRARRPLELLDLGRSASRPCGVIASPPGLSFPAIGRAVWRLGVRERGRGEKMR